MALRLNSILPMISQDTARWAAWQKFTVTVEMGSAYARAVMFAA